MIQFPINQFVHVCFYWENTLTYVNVTLKTPGIVKKVNIGYANRLVAEGLELLIKGFEGYDVLHCIHNGKLLSYTSLNLSETSILIIELDIPRRSDIVHIRAILKTYPGISILLITGHPTITVSSELLDSGIHAYILKSCVPSDLKTALDKISDGKNYFCSTITGELLLEKNNHHQDERLNQLTPREREILILLVNINATCEIARKLKISENTVKTHKRNIQAKLGFKNIIEMLLFAVRNNLVEVGYNDLCFACPYFANN